MNNEIKLNDIVNELHTLYCDTHIYVTKFKFLTNNIKSFIERNPKEHQDEFYFIIIDIYNELLNLPKNTKTGKVNKIAFNHLYNYYKDKTICSQNPKIK